MEATVPIVCQAGRQPWGVQLEEETEEWCRWGEEEGLCIKGVGGESEIAGL